jgi:hypothetical protein
MLCNTCNLTQLVNSVTRLNIKYPLKSSLIDLILTNTPHHLNASGIFANDISDHCARGGKIPKKSPRVITKRNWKRFDIQGFLHDVSSIEWNRMELIPDVERTFSYFHNTFQDVCNRHAPFKKYRIKGRENPWFTKELTKIIRERNG